MGTGAVFPTAVFGARPSRHRGSPRHVVPCTGGLVRVVSLSAGHLQHLQGLEPPAQGPEPHVVCRPRQQRQGPTSDKWTGLRFLWPLCDPSPLARLLIYVALKRRVSYLVLGTLDVQNRQPRTMTHYWLGLMNEEAISLPFPLVPCLVQHYLKCYQSVGVKAEKCQPECGHGGLLPDD